MHPLGSIKFLRQKLFRPCPVGWSLCVWSLSKVSSFPWLKTKSISVVWKVLLYARRVIMSCWMKKNGRRFIVGLNERGTLFRDTLDWMNWLWRDVNCNCFSPAGFYRRPNKVYYNLRLLFFYLLFILHWKMY